MSDYTTKATAVLEVNGDQAKSEIPKLKKLIVDLDVAVNNAAKAGNKPLLKSLKKELKDARFQLKQFESAAQAADYVMRTLDKATPKQLRAALRQLKKELNDIDRGSKAWDEQVRKIKRVQTELDRVNKQMKGNETLWTRFSKTMFQWGNALMVAAGAMTGLVMSGRRAVEAFAEMDQEMANVRKYTGMAAEQVEALNKEFKQMNTRSSRQQLNKLAQEAGRLGMQSQEDVMGFVRAADQINVALDELGEGATLTLSKLTNIFGDRERLGVEKSLLAVGSVINELSQNSTASANYLAEFASRLGGTGAQAKMTTQQIMAYGAVLDSYNQKVEASSTALSQVIVRLYQDPAKYAKVAGLDVKEFADLLRKDANAALIMFLETLNKVGGMDVLSPMFKDMGENGARAIQALSTLAKHIDEVKSQQAVANQAFEEATSVTKEFNVQNNTVQAQLDKAKKKFNELTVSLGEKLMPVMRYAITGSSAMIRALSITVDFFIKYKGVIFTVTAAIVAYKVAVNAANIIDNIHYVLLLAKDALMKTHKTTVLLCSLAYNKLTGNITRANAAQKLLNTTMKLNPWGLVAAAITAAVAALVMFTRRTNDAAKAQKALNDIKKEAAKRMAEEKQRIDTLMAAANNMNLTYAEQKRAVDELNKTIPGFNGNIDASTRAFTYSEAALRKYNNELMRLYEIQGAKDKLAELGKQKAELLIKKQEVQDAINREMANVPSTRPQTSQGNAVPGGVGAAVGHSSMLANLRWDLSSIEDDLKSVDAMMKAIFKSYGTDLQRQAVAAPGVAESSISGAGYSGGGSGSGSGSGGSSAKTDKFAAEKSWREREIALNKIAWLTGEKDYEAYTNRMLEIEAQYHAKRLQHEDLEGNEQVTIQAEYLEARKKQQEQYDKWTIEEENQAYARLKAEVQNDYLQNRISRATYNMELENIEMAHMRAMAYITREGTDERKKAEDDYRAALVADQQKRQQEQERKEQAHQKKLEEIWDEYAVSQEEKKKRIREETEKLLGEIYKSKLALLEMDDSLSPEEKNRKINELTTQYKNALKKLNEPVEEGARSLEDYISKLLDKMFGEGTWKKYGDAIKSMYTSIASMFDGLNKMAEADSELRLARLEKYYEREISMAEGNAYKVKQIERKKQKEEAKLKAEATKRQFAQQVIAAVAETALAAIRAYATAPAPTMIWGPIAAAMAVAAGGIQIAAIKKQQAASLAQGYSQGGFTPDGRPDQPVGVVHAGEWVASQKLLKNPQTRAAIDALDYAQRNNTIGRISAADVSRSITAPSIIAGAAGDGTMQRTMEAMVAVMARYGDTMSRLGERLDEPFVTVNTVEGDMGIKKAQDDYQKMINNTLPKNKRK